jgi:acetyltransferase-like isoleucine patch superfamily enzyme
MQGLGRRIASYSPYLDIDKTIVLRPDMIRYGSDCRFDGFTKFEGGLGIEIGDFVHIASFAHIGVGGGRTIIGNYVGISSGAKIISGAALPDALCISACAPQESQHVERRTTELKDYSAVFTNAVVLPGITLHEGAVLGAGSVATIDIPAWEVWTGNPAVFRAKRVLR